MRNAYLIMCCHKICKDRSVDINKFDIKHHHQQRCTISFEMGNDICYSQKKTNETKNTLGLI